MKVSFDEYNGWTNFPTWAIFTHVTSYFESGRQFEEVAQYGRVEHDTKGLINNFLIHGLDDKNRMIHLLLSDFLMNGVRKIDWSWVNNRLQGLKEIPREPHELSELALELLRQYPNYQDLIIAGNLGGTDSNLQSWTESQLITWVGSKRARMPNSPISQLANKIIEIYLNVVDWDKLTSAFKGE